MEILRLKSTISTIVGDTVNVIFAAVDSPGAILVPSRFQVKVISLLEFDGIQPEVVKFKSSETVEPVFSMYTVFIMVPSAVMLL